MNTFNFDAHPIRWEQPRAQRSRLRVLEAALALFREHGFEATTFQQIATRAETSLGLACRYFSTKEHLALALYDQLANELQAWALEMPEGGIGSRFGATMRAKLALLEPHRRTLLALAGKALDPNARAGVLGQATQVVRTKVSGVFALAIAGASPAPPAAEIPRLERALYAVHLGLVLLWTQDTTEDRRAVHAALDAIVDAMNRFEPALAMAMSLPFVGRMDGILRDLFGATKPTTADDIARAILARIFARRRTLPDAQPSSMEAALALHLPKVRAFVEAGEPVLLVLPAFPAKAPNPRKVLGARPDMAEQLALESLESLVREIGELHRPGAQLLVGSDGHVFADVVGVRDQDVTRYRAGLETMIGKLETGRIRILGLEDTMGESRPSSGRALLLERYGSDLDAIRARAARSPTHRAQLDGIHRFLFEDEIVRHPELSRTQARKQTRARAEETVRRSDAWGRLLAAMFPRAVRLSIHPQPDVSEKIGIHLLATDDAWLTPWHGVAVLHEERFRLMKRAEAEALGAVVVKDADGANYMEVSP